MRLYRRTQNFPNGTRREWGPWWVQFHIRGKLVRKSLKTRDKRAAEIAAAELLRKEELKSAGVFDPHEEQKTRSVEDHLAEFESVLLARDVVHNTARSGSACCARSSRGRRSGGSGTSTSPTRAGGSRSSRRTGLSARSLNSRITGLKQLGAWLFRTHRLPFDPFSTLEKRNEAADPRHVRRALTPDEVGRLIEAARRGSLDRARRRATVNGLSPKYVTRLTAWGEGRRARLRHSDRDGPTGRRDPAADLGGRRPREGARARVTARSAKSRTEQTVDLHPGLVATLRAARPAGRATRHARVPQGCFPTIRIFDEDIAEAGIEKTRRLGARRRPTCAAAHLHVEPSGGGRPPPGRHGPRPPQRHLAHDGALHRRFAARPEGRGCSAGRTNSGG